jgi:hypothetical protein
MPGHGRPATAVAGEGETWPAKIELTVVDEFLPVTVCSRLTRFVETHASVLLTAARGPHVSETPTNGAR